MKVAFLRKQAKGVLQGWIERQEGDVCTMNCQPDNRTEKISESRFLKCGISLASDSRGSRTPKTLAPMPLPVKRSLAWLLAVLFDREKRERHMGDRC